MRRPSAPTLVSLAAVGGVVLFVIWQLHPSLLFSNTTTAGGDTGAHVALAAYLRSHLLTQGRITGWSPEWYAGYPAFTFYFPLPSLLIALVSYVIPYDIAFKLVTVLGMVTLPVAAWTMGRLFRMPRPGPVCLAVATLPFLFDRTFTIYGGNIASTLAGEFAFSISLSLALVFLGVVARGFDGKRHRALAASLFAACLLCHLIPAIFAAVGALVLCLMGGGRARWLRTAGAVAVGAALTGFWAVPFVLRQRYTTDMGFEKVSDYVQSLFPSSQRWVLVLAVVGAAASIALRRRIGIFLTVMAALSALAFVVDPQGKLYNGRLLPFWVLCLYLLAGAGATEVGALAVVFARALRDRWRRPPQPVVAAETSLLDAAARPAASPATRLGSWLREGPLSAAATRRRPDLPGAVTTPLFAVVAAMVFVVLPLVTLPSWLDIQPSFIPSWVNWNYTGYEGKAAYPEYRSLIATMRTVGREHGCGRAMWEYEPELDQMGTPMALMLLPYWTNLCIDSMEGLLFESSATTPYHFLNQAELSANPSEPVRGLDYGPLDVTEGVKHLQLLGVRYYMAVSPAAQQQAGEDPDLTLIARSGPWPVTVGSQRVMQTWDVYQVADSAEVAPLTAQPVVLAQGDSSAAAWLKASLAWYGDSGRQGVALAADGPGSWKRVGPDDAVPPRTPLRPAAVSAISQGPDSISFNVNRTGSPVLVKVSYFPNWKASGAEGPWRVAPNLMVVVPTSKHVSLRYGYTPVDVLGWLFTAAGIVGIAWLALELRIRRWTSNRRARRETPLADHEGEEPPGELEELTVPSSP